jgi:hypothetical protein
MVVCFIYICVYKIYTLLDQLFWLLIFATLLSKETTSENWACFVCLCWPVYNCDTNCGSDKMAPAHVLYTLPVWQNTQLK